MSTDINSKIKKVSITSEKFQGRDVTKEDIINEAKEIWEEVQTAWSNIVVEKKTKGKKAGQTKMKRGDIENLDKLFSEIRNKHKEFSQSYPTVLRHMVQENWFNIKAFSRYMDKLAQKSWGNDNERMDSYTDYAVELMKETHYKGKHLNRTTVNAFRVDYRARLQKEHDDFMSRIEEITKKVEDEQREVEQGRREDLLKAFKRLANSLKVPEEKQNQVEELVKNDLLQTDALDRMVTDMYRLVNGESPATIREEREKEQKRIAEKLQNQQVVLPDNMDPEEAAAMKARIEAMAAENIHADDDSDDDSDDDDENADEEAN